MFDVKLFQEGESKEQNIDLTLLDLPKIEPCSFRFLVQF
jgi:hypothetical protein